MTGNYSHGLERIYELETIDPKSIRKMEPLNKSKGESQFIDDSPQIEFDLGPGFRGWAPPFLLQEPFQVLRLDPKIESILREAHLLRIEDFIAPSFPTPDQLNLLGRARLEMVKSKLTFYLRGKEVKRTRSIDFLSLVKRLFVDFDLKKSYVFLSSYRLQAWLGLTPSELKDVQQLTPRIIQAWKEEAKQYLKALPLKSMLEEQWGVICKEWLYPWMTKRGGVASLDEISQFLLLKAQDLEEAEKALSFLFEYAPLQEFVMQKEGIFSAGSVYDEWLERFFHHANSYFPSYASCYSLEKIIAYIQEEFAKEWIKLEPDFIEKLFRLTPKFSVQANVKGEWLVTLKPKQSSSRKHLFRPH